MERDLRTPSSCAACTWLRLLGDLGNQPPPFRPWSRGTSALGSKGVTSPPQRDQFCTERLGRRELQGSKARLSTTLGTDVSPPAGWQGGGGPSTLWASGLEAWGAIRWVRLFFSVCSLINPSRWQNRALWGSFYSLFPEHEALGLQEQQRSAGCSCACILRDFQGNPSQPR